MEFISNTRFDNNSRECWPHILTNAKGGPGGKRKEYRIEALPQVTRDYLAIQYFSESICHFPEGSPAAIGAAIGAKIVHEATESKQRTSAVHEQSLAEFASLSPARQLEAKAKLALLEARDAFMRQAGIKSIVPASEKFSALYNIGEIKLPEQVANYAQRSGRLSVSWPSLNRWRKAYERHGIMGLVNGYKSPSKTSVPTDIQEFIQGLYTSYPHIKLQRIFDAIGARFDGRDDKPSNSAVRRYADKWTRENESLLLYLKNPDAWKNEQMLALGNASEQILALNQLWEMDSTPNDVMLLDGRFTLVGCLDVFSRRAKMLVAPTSKATYVSSLIRRCIIDWGCPPATREDKSHSEGIKTDNGADYVADHIDLVLSALSINHPLCPPFSPEKKPHIERFFRTFSHGIVELLPGFIGHNVAERKAIEAQRTFAQRLMKSGEEAVKIELTSEQLQQICDRWVNAIYHQDKHSELGMSPAEKARSWTGPVRRIENLRALDMLLMPSPGLRTLQKKGIKANHGWYVALEFAPLTIGDQFRVFEDPTDLGTIYVYRPAGEFICVAQDPTRTGIDRAELASRARAIQKSIMTEGSKKLRKQAKQLGTEKAFEEILDHRERKIANVIDLPQKTELYTTEALEQAGLAASARQQQVVDPQQRRAERAALEESMAESGKLTAFPTDSAGRLRHYRQLTNRTKAGERLSEREAIWLADFSKTAEGRMMAELEKDCLTMMARQ